MNKLFLILSISIFLTGCSHQIIAHECYRVNHCPEGEDCEKEDFKDSSFECRYP